jgi:DNA invertase Pin-like site-specific DNA recombinase
MGHSDWSKTIPTNEAYKRAGGRARINAQRQLNACYKASEVIKLYQQLCQGQASTRGIQAQICKVTGLSRSSVSRYIQNAYKRALEHQVCSCCGARTFF